MVAAPGPFGEESGSSIAYSRVPFRNVRTSGGPKVGRPTTAQEPGRDYYEAET